MRNHSSFPYFLFPFLVNEPKQRMESPPDFERANALQILAFEVEPYRWLRGRLAFKRRADQCLRCLRCGCDGIQRSVGEQRSAVDVWLNSFVRTAHVGWGKREP